MLDFLFNWIEKGPEWLIIILAILSIGGGFVLLIKGADFFVDGAACLAKKIGVSSLVIGLTVVSIGTSLPEASVSISSAIRHNTNLSISNVVGSNIFNILVVLGAACLFASISIKKSVKFRDVPALLISGIVLLIFIVAFSKTGNYDILRYEAIILLALFIIYVVISIVTSKDSDVENVDDSKQKYKLWACILIIIGSGLAIAVGGEFVTWGSKKIALELGVSDLIIGLTIVAIGTSLPELITSIVASKKHEDDIALGNVIGSSIFNILFILGMAGTISPYMNVDPAIIFDISVMLGVFVVTSIIFILSKKGIGKKTGIFFLIMYAVYFSYIIARVFI